jgi:hypothetical protein
MLALSTAPPLLNFWTRLLPKSVTKMLPVESIATERGELNPLLMFA